jgi:hypothetical protein
MISLEIPAMAEKTSKLTPERLIEAPIIFCDAVPTISVNNGIVDLTLAATLTEVVDDGNQRKRLVVVADLKLPLATATALHDLLGKLMLAVQPAAGGTN